MTSGPGAGPRLTHEEKFPGGRLKATWSSRIGANGDVVLDGPETWFYPDGRKHYEVTYDFGRKIGRETFWRQDGGIAWTWDRRPDSSGTWTRYWENGQKRTESNWRGLKADGPAVQWDPAGRTVATLRISRGRLDSALAAKPTAG